MKILLVAINAKYIHSCPAVYSLRAGSGHPDMVEIAEFTINDRYQDILSGILERKADFIGFSTYIWNRDLVLDLLTDLRVLLKGNALLFAGGPEASNATQKFLAGADFVICGEGEKPFRLIADYAAGLCSASDSHSLSASRNPTVQPSGSSAIKSAHSSSDINGRDADQRRSLTAIAERMNAAARSLSAIAERMNAAAPGVADFVGNRLIIGPFPPELADTIDSLPFLYDNIELFDNRIIYYESSRGCPFNCTYCLSSIDRRVRFRDIDTVLRELQFFIDSRVPQVKFIDRTFNSNHKRTMTIWSYLRDHDNGMTNFHFEVGADLLNEEELALLEDLRPGLVQLEAGIQSTHPETLTSIRRSTDLSVLFANVARLQRSRNINLHVDLIAGLPYEGLAEFANSFNDVYALHADQLQLGFLKVLGGTEILKKAAEYDIRYSQRPPYEVLSTKWISWEELDMLRRISDVLDAYCNSQQFIHTLTYLEKFWDSAFDFFRRLAEFFRKNGYDRAKPASAKRYEVLDLFIAEDSLNYKAFQISVFREYLRFDRSLHIHRSRRRSIREEYDFGDGPVRIEIDYDRRNIITGEAFYRVTPLPE